jgi:hypothetical protein
MALKNTLLTALRVVKTVLIPLQQLSNVQYALRRIYVWWVVILPMMGECRFA